MWRWCWPVIALILPACVHLSPERVADYEGSCVPVAQQLDPRPDLLDLADCLDHPNPEIRDAYAYETLQTRLRDETPPAADLKALQQRLSEMLVAEDPGGYGPPFAALIMAEIARTDRMSSWMTPAERAATTQSAAEYLINIGDYRGFVDGEGWRHGVAHGADWLMQLSLNPELNRAQARLILDAVGRQVAPRTHAYVHGEPARLARPVLYVLQSGLMEESDWAEFFETLSDPAPMIDWSDAFLSEAGLRQRHNTKAFLTDLVAALSAVDRTRFPEFRANLESAYRAVP